MGAFPFCPRSSSHGNSTKMFLPFHGTFFFKRGGAGAGEGTGATPCVGNNAALHSSFGGGGGCSSPGDVKGSLSPAEAAFPIISDMLGRAESGKCSCFKVSVLGCLCGLGFDRRFFSWDSRNRLRVGVRGSGSCTLSPEIDPLSEECSLSPGSSLSQ